MGTVKSVDEQAFVSYYLERYSDDEMRLRSRSFYEWMNSRRSVRHFSPDPIPREVIEHLILTASAAPSGAHRQPWNFCVVTDPDTKRRIRIAAEEEEYESYHGRMSEEWLKDLQPLGTDWHKPFLEIAPALIVVFKKSWDQEEDGSRHQNYYVQESCGLAVGFLLAAIHHVGLVALTHTPSPMNFLSQILQRPDNEKPFLLIPIGYPAPGCQVPNLRRKPLEKVMVWY
ncbi:MAG: nitroreductase family protein [Chitinophagaceae bacterium]|jgi:nitroreductase|nr:nitroreductase family protein [Chitinophagaceae bacterium]